MLSGWGSILRSARQTALLHLKPLPKAICHTRSLRFTRPWYSEYASSYQIDEDDVLPNLKTSKSESFEL